MAIRKAIKRNQKYTKRQSHLPILQCLQIDPRQWRYLTSNFESRFRSLVGTEIAVRQACEKLGKRWAQGIRDCARYLSANAPPANFF